LERAALGRPTAAAADDDDDDDDDALVLSRVREMHARAQGRSSEKAPNKAKPAQRMPLISAIAAGDSFSLAIVGWGHSRGQLLYWGGDGGGDGGGVGGGDGRTHQRVPQSRRLLSDRNQRRSLSDRPADVGDWYHELWGKRFLLVSAFGRRALALADDGTSDGVSARVSARASDCVSDGV
jgi:hypothetical protein